MVAQLVVWLLPAPEIRGLNPNIGKTLSTNYIQLKRKDKIKEKVAGNGPSLKKESLRENQVVMHLQMKDTLLTDRNRNGS